MVAGVTVEGEGCSSSTVVLWLCYLISKINNWNGIRNSVLSTPTMLRSTIALLSNVRTATTRLQNLAVPKARVPFQDSRMVTPGGSNLGKSRPGGV